MFLLRLLGSPFYVSADLIKIFCRCLFQGHQRLIDLDSEFLVIEFLNDTIVFNIEDVRGVPLLADIRRAFTS